MESIPNMMSPRDSFSVTGQSFVDASLQVVLANLYQPIVGSDAFSVYNTFLSEVAVAPDKLTRGQLHSYLLTTCNMSLSQFYQARLRLEGIGLLRSFKKENMTGHHHYLYELLAPLSASRFFQDGFLSVMLLEAVGKSRYEKLLHFFAPAKISTETYEEVTQSFGDVFEFKIEKLSSQDSVITEGQSRFQNLGEKIPSEISQKFDWLFFQDYLKRNFFNMLLFTDELKEVVSYFYTAYGYNEMEIAELMIEIYTTEGDAFSIELLKQKVYEKYHRTQEGRMLVKDKQKAVSTHESKQQQEDTRRNQLIQAGFSKDEMNLILSCETRSPLAFLQEAKEGLGGFVTPDERKTIEHIMQNTQLPSSVINILIHYLLVVQRKPKIYQSTADTIANDWGMEKINSPEGAIQKVRDFYKKQSQPKEKANGSKYPTRKGNRKETLPDWAKNDTLKVEKSLSNEEKAAIEARIKGLTKNHEGGD